MNCELDWSMQRHMTGADAWLQALDESVIVREGGLHTAGEVWYIRLRCWCCVTQIHVTPEGVATPIRFVVRLVGSVPMSTADRDTCSSLEFVERHVRRLCGRRHAAAETPSNVVYYWPTVSADCFVLKPLIISRESNARLRSTFCMTPLAAINRKKSTSE